MWVISKAAIVPMCQFKSIIQWSFLQWKNNNLFEVSAEKRLEIESLTRGQASHKYWFAERCLRLNSSNFGEICLYTDPYKLVNSLLNPKDLSNVPSIKHGKKYEVHAKKIFEMKGYPSIR